MTMTYILMLMLAFVLTAVDMSWAVTSCSGGDDQN